MLDARLMGRRVVVRYRRPAPDGLPPLSDLVGDVVAVDMLTATIATRRGDVTVALSSVLAVRVVAASSRAILELERISHRGWRAAEVLDLDGWQLHADRGWTGRANSVLPLATSATPLPDLLSRAAAFYRERALPLQIQIPLPVRSLLDAELARRGWVLDRPTIVLTRPIPTRALLTRELAAGSLPEFDVEPVFEVELATRPSPRWLAAYHYRGGSLPDAAMDLLARHDQVRFASVVDGSEDGSQDGGETIGIARGAVDEGWLGVSAVEVSADHRRRGVATALMLALSGWASDLAATHCYLQVDDGNAGALALYETLGFTEHHRYHYRLDPSRSGDPVPTDSPAVVRSTVPAGLPAPA